MPCLLEVQRGFRTAVLTGASMSPSLVNNGTVSAAVRLRVYRNNVLGNLTRALRLNYPAVERLVGEDFFAVAAQRFIEATLPRAADLNQYGGGFAEFLASFEEAASVLYLPDVARLEWAVSRALHAPPAEPVSPAALSAVLPEREPELCFQAHPTLSLLAFEYPAHAIWEAVLADEPDQRDTLLAAIDIQAGGETLAVLRSAGALDVKALAAPAFELAQALAAGRPLSEALERVPADDAAPLLADFLTRGFFASFAFPAEDATITQGTLS